MKEKKLTDRVRAHDRQEKDKMKWKKPVISNNIKPVRNTRISRKSGAR